MVSGQVCYKVLPSINPMVMCMLKFGEDYTSLDHKNIVNECLLTGLHEKVLGSKSVLISVHIASDIMKINFVASLINKRYIFA